MSLNLVFVLAIVVAAVVASDYQEKPAPYTFGYQIADHYGGHGRHESGDGYGNKRGSYSLTDADGRVRKVDYVADDYGFRAQIKTNEPGTNGKDSADAVVNGPDNYGTHNAVAHGAHGHVAHGTHGHVAPASSYGAHSYVAAPRYGGHGYSRSYNYGAPSHGRGYGGYGNAGYGGYGNGGYGGYGNGGYGGYGNAGYGYGNAGYGYGNAGYGYGNAGYGYGNAGYGYSRSYNYGATPSHGYGYH
ncbi:Uncharacterised protein g4054 [Pycnogonum litorale]